MACFQHPASSRTLYVIGSPAPGEVKARHPFQFVEAAVYRELDSNTLCLVEKTGFEKAKVDLKEVERKLAPATVQPGRGWWRSAGGHHTAWNSGFFHRDFPSGRG